MSNNMKMRLEDADETKSNMFETSSDFDLVCLSHLRWDFVYQRPQHLLSRCAKERRVFFVEEPIFGDESDPRLDVSAREDKLQVVVPRLPRGMNDEEIINTQRELLDQFFAENGIREYALWYYTPMALRFSDHLKPVVTIYDCMDELSAFKGASPELKERERELFERATMVFTGGQSLFEVKRNQHASVHLFPSSVDVKHFAQARGKVDEPLDQLEIPHPRLGFFGVIDERMDFDLIEAVAEARPDWQLVMIGPVVKIDDAALPQRENIHYLGSKDYKELPNYLAGWDVALLTFARNESTRFISPTKTPEYLAAGRPVVSTSIHDVVRPYGEGGYVRIADTPEEFVAAVEATLNGAENKDEWLKRVDELLAHNSWDRTWERMSQLIKGEVARKRGDVSTVNNNSKNMTDNLPAVKREAARRVSAAD